MWLTIHGYYTTNLDSEPSSEVESLTLRLLILPRGIQQGNGWWTYLKDRKKNESPKVFFTKRHTQFFS